MVTERDEKRNSLHNVLFGSIGCFHITGGLKGHLNMTVLTVSSGLLFILVFHIRFLTDGLPISYSGFIQFNLNLILVQKTADHHVQMLITHTADESLSVGSIIDHL